MNDNEASQQRIVVIREMCTDRFLTYKGDEVYSITQIGIVIASMSTRILCPWHTVEYFSYHTLDTSARKAIQGY